MQCRCHGAASAGPTRKQHRTMDLITNALSTLQQMVNQALQNEAGTSSTSGPIVVLGSPVNPDGSLNDTVRDKVAMVLYNLQRETSLSSRGGAQQGAGGLSTGPAPLYLDMDIAFLANYAGKRYADGLSAISQVISFFQQNPVFTQSSAPELDPQLGKLSVEFTSLTAADLSYVMGVIGTKYVPSAFYQVRLIPFNAATIKSRVPAVGTPKVASPGGSTAL
jgi:hypothetical protein